MIAEDANIASREVHSRIVRKFKRRTILANFKDEIWSADLCVMDTVDNGYKYILTIIDIYTRFAFATPLPNKQGETVKKAFSSVFKEWNRKPQLLFTDKGTEFYNAIFHQFLSKHLIKIYSTQSELKASIVERLNKTLKHKMERVITANELQGKSSSWSKILIDIVYEYNYNDVHSFHNVTPNVASNEDFQEKLKSIWVLKFSQSLPVKRSKAKFRVNDYVRIYRWKAAFEKGYKKNFTIEVFRIKAVLPTNPFTYTIEDSSLEEIVGSFYENELIKTAFTFNNA